MRNLLRHAPLGLLAFLVACGGGPGPRPAPGPNTAADVEADLAATAQAPQATATFAIFSAEAPPRDLEAARKSLEAAAQASFRSPPAELADLVRGRRAPEGLVIRPMAADDLPLDRAVLVAAGGAHGAAIAAAQTARVIRVAGPADGEGEVLRTAALAAALTTQTGEVVVDLSLWRAFSRAELVADLGRPDWLADQVVPDVRQEAAGTLTLSSRGMGRFGLPDLAQVGVAPAEGRAAFGAFQAYVNRLRTSGPNSEAARSAWAAPTCPELIGAADGECRQVPTSP